MDRSRSLIIISHLWPGNPQSSNPLSGIYVKEQAAELRKMIGTEVLVPVSLIPKISSFIMNFKAASKEMANRIGCSSDDVIFLKYPPLFGKHGNAVLIAALASGKCSQKSIVHAHTLFPDGLAAFIISRIKKTRYIVTLHGSEVMFIDKKPVNKMVARIICRNASSIISVSERMADKIRKLTGRSEGIYVVRNGIDKMFPMTSGGREFLFVGKMIDVKDPLILIEAFSLFAKEFREWKLTIVGDGPLRGLAVKRAAELGLSERIEFAGFVGRESIGGYFSRAHALVISSRSEGFPTIIYEAMSAGLPVVSFNIGGVAEAVRSGENGVISNERNAESLYESMKKSALINWNRSAIRDEASDFTYEKISKKIFEIYKSI